MVEDQRPAKILIVDDEKVIRDSFSRVLLKEGYAVEAVESGRLALERVTEESFDIALLDLKMPGLDGMETLRELKEKDPDVVSVMITGYPTIENAVAAVKLGAYDYLTKPCSPDDLRLVVARAAERRKLIFENEQLRRRREGRGISELIIGKSKVMQRIMEIIYKVAPTESTVLITGESGTGKELVAQTIHQLSPRKEKEFVPVDCNALVESLLESELFGHVKGSFTGAVSTKHGLFELANGGTFFFDEVGNLTLNTQAKLLRAIQEREVKPVGGSQRIRVDVRIIAATNQNLMEAIAKRTFREDLFYRLSVVPIHLPPLRERKEDLPLLVQHFIQRYNRKRKKPIEGISPAAMELLMKHHWPGNVRELENTIERAMILEEREMITPKSLPWLFLTEPMEKSTPLPKKLMSLEDMEKEHIAHVLKETGGHKSRAAKILGIDRKTLYQKVQKYQL
ncbi:MAG: sigma-54-dependent Fis family transcriptional regulator [Deltaproteobacteria bacterium]|nr:sigma-54-dependent Fis family transcriptional regulator [Deltaproteobacteria bacterium]